MGKTLFIASVMLLTTANAEPPTIPTPSFKVGDTWIFDETRQQGTNGFGQQRIDLTVERTSGDTMLIGVKRDGAPTAYEDHVVGVDWSQRHVVDGQEVPTTRPLNFPMRIGEKWTIDFSDATRRGMQTSLHVHRTYTVAGWRMSPFRPGCSMRSKSRRTGLARAS